jgi:hypothetical protein
MVEISLLKMMLARVQYLRYRRIYPGGYGGYHPERHMRGTGIVSGVVVNLVR